MSQTTERYSATYLYPGTLFPEEITHSLPEPTLAAALAVAPDEDGYFRKDGWYAVRIHKVVMKRYVADDGTDLWNNESTEQVGSWIVGERIHYSEIPDTADNRILISNIRGNSKDGYGVHTRVGNWQIASDYDAVISPAEAA